MPQKGLYCTQMQIVLPKLRMNMRIESLVRLTMTVLTLNTNLLDWFFKKSHCICQNTTLYCQTTIIVTAQNISVFSQKQLYIPKILLTSRNKTAFAPKYNYNCLNTSVLSPNMTSCVHNTTIQAPNRLYLSKILDGVGPVNNRPSID